MQVRTLRGLGIGMSAALGLAIVAPSAHAQAQEKGMRFGVEAAFGTQDVGIGAGAFVKFHVADVSEHSVTGRVTFDYFFPSSSNFGGFSTHFWTIEADGLVDIVSKGDTKPYVGAGLTYSKWSYGYDTTYCGIYASLCNASASHTGLDIVGGLNFMANAKLMPFVEAKLELSSGSAFIIRGGVHF